MTTSEIIDSLKHLSTRERLVVIEAASRLIRQEMQGQPEASREERYRRMNEAAVAVKDLYAAGGELTEWTSLDAEEVLDDYLGR